MTMFNKTRHNRDWTTQKFIELSQTMGQAYCLGLDPAKSPNQKDVWTAKKYISMSKNLSSAYGIDY